MRVMKAAWVLLCSFFCPSRAAVADPEPPIWPDVFSAITFQNKSGELAYTTLVYDWPNGRNLLSIWKQQGNIVFDVEWTNGTSFFYDLQAKTCKTLHFPVGILAPDWLANATYLGIEEIDSEPCHKWAKADFITYWASVKTGFPVRWLFFNGAQFEVMSYLPGFSAIPEELWQAPSYCFEDDASSDASSELRLRNFTSAANSEMSLRVVS